MTVCWKQGHQQWSCTYEECNCHLKATIARRLAEQGNCPCPDGCNGCEYLENENEHETLE